MSACDEENKNSKQKKEMCWITTEVEFGRITLSVLRVPCRGEDGISL